MTWRIHFCTYHVFSNHLWIVIDQLDDKGGRGGGSTLLQNLRDEKKKASVGRRHERKKDRDTWTRNVQPAAACGPPDYYCPWGILSLILYYYFALKLITLENHYFNNNKKIKKNSPAVLTKFWNSHSKGRYSFFCFRIWTIFRILL